MMRYRLMRYRLNEKGEPVPEPDLYAWAHWYEKAERHVCDEHINGIRISTVFLGLDHQFGEGPPILWETMLFDKKGREDIDNTCWRCSGSREQAEAMHARAVAHVKNLPGT